jgi:hypothetical protein
MSATQLGAAAAYEAYRTWVHNDNLYDSIDGRDELQREALCGLAVAEGKLSLSITVFRRLILLIATRLWHSVQNRMDRVGLQTACEVAAATASLTFDMVCRHNFPSLFPNNTPCSFRARKTKSCA